jgi:branched-chain amino acid transport system permease protein
MSICSLSWRLLMVIGQLSFGQGGFVGIGAYASALMAMKLGFPFWVSLPLSALIAGLLGAIIGYPGLRLKGAYFVIMTLILGECIRLLIQSWQGLTNGVNGITDISPPSAISIPGLLTVNFTTKAPFYYLVLGLLIITVIVMRRIDKSSLGSTFRGIAQSDSLAESLGVNIARYKVLAFGISCFFCGVAGSFFAHYMAFVHPDNFNIWLSAYMVIYSIVGGMGSVAGPILGSLVMVSAVELFRPLQNFQAISYAVVLIVAIMFLPGGFVSLKDFIQKGLAVSRINK